MTELIEGLEAVTVHVRDVERARAFYSNVLGLKEVGTARGAPRAAFAIPGSTTLLTMHVMAENEGGREPGTVSGIVFAHHDPPSACEEIRRRGGTIVSGPEVLTLPVGVVTRCVLADPDGNEFILRHVHP